MAVEEPARPPCRLTRAAAEPKPKCTCMRFLGKVIPCRWHREAGPEVQQPVMTAWRMPMVPPANIKTPVVQEGQQPTPAWLDDDDPTWKAV